MADRPDGPAIERIFREESGQVLASLIRVLGDFDLAEDAYQEATGIPGGAVRASVGLVSTIGDVEALVTLISSEFADRPARDRSSVRPEHASLVPA